MDHVSGVISAEVMNRQTVEIHLYQARFRALSATMLHFNQPSPATKCQHMFQEEPLPFEDVLLSHQISSPKQCKEEWRAHIGMASATCFLCVMSLTVTQVPV